MVNPIGIVSYGLWGKENTYGTAPATINKVFMELQSASFKPKDEMFKKRSVGGGQDVQASYLGLHEVTVDLDLLLTTQGDLWELVLGGEPTDDGTGTMVVNVENNIPSFTTHLAYKGYDGDLTGFNIVGCKISSAEISVSKGDTPAKLKLSVVGQKETKVAPVTQVNPAGELLTQLDTTIEKDGNVIANVQELTLSINRNVDKKTSVGERFVTNLYEKVRDYTFSMKLYFEDMDRYEEFWGGTTEPTGTAVKNKIDNITINIVRNANVFTKFYLSDVYWEEIETPIELEDLVVCNVSGYAHTLNKIEYKG